MLVLDARKSARLSINRLSTKRVIEVLSETEPSPLDRLAHKNPALLSLIEVFGLVEVASTVEGSPVPVPLPPLPPVNAEPANPKLRILANQTFDPNRTYSESEAIIRLADKTNVSEERAANGLSMMLRQNILALTLSKSYYLSESTPF